MKYFDRDGKHNWVDENNVVVGYDSGQDCCEHAGYYYTQGAAPVAVNTDLERETNPDIEPYSFDAEWFNGDLDTSSCDEGGAVVFRLVAPNLPDIYLVIFNSHNGYYGHGFEMNVVGISTRSGCL